MADFRSNISHSGVYFDVHGARYHGARDLPVAAEDRPAVRVDDDESLLDLRHRDK